MFEGYFSLNGIFSKFVYGMAISGPLSHGFYCRLLPRLVPKVDAIGSTQKMMLD